MRFEQVESLVRLVAETQVAEVEVKMGGVHVRVVRDAAPGHLPTAHVVPVTGAATSPPVSGASRSAGTGPAATAPEVEEEGLHVIRASMVGTYYRRPNPEAEPFVKEGSVIKKGQVICILEAMKILNEIESDCDGTVVRLLATDGLAVEFGEKLMVVRPL